MHMLEANPLQVGLDLSLKNSKDCDCQVGIFSDSKAVTGALWNGRSSSNRLNRTFSNIAAFVSTGTAKLDICLVRAESGQMKK